MDLFLFFGCIHLKVSEFLCTFFTLFPITCAFHCLYVLAKCCIYVFFCVFYCLTANQISLWVITGKCKMKLSEERGRTDSVLDVILDIHIVLSELLDCYRVPLPTPYCVFPPCDVQSNSHRVVKIQMDSSIKAFFTSSLQT